MNRNGQKWVMVPVLLLFVAVAGMVWAQEGETTLLPQPAPGSLPDLKPPPGIQITRDAFDSLMRKPFNDDWDTPPWERENVEPSKTPAERVFQPEVLEEPGSGEPGSGERVEVIRVPERVEDGVVLPPLLRPDALVETPEVPTLVFEKNPYAARARAVEEGKFMLLAFVGTEWNSASRQLSWEVFNSPDFIEYATEHLVPCFLDYPQKQTSGDSALARFKRHYDVGGLPAVVLFDSEGTPYVKKSGYLSKSEAAYLLELKALVNQRKEVLKARRKKQESQGFREWTNLEGRVFFGKVTKIEGGEVWFVDGLGVPAKVALEKLSAGDRILLGQ